MNLTDKQMAEYCQRSYTAVDGLWFVKLEERFGFDSALEIDNEVWKILPKIQARLLKSMLRAADGLTGLRECLAAKYTIEGYKFEIQENADGITISFHQCPWHDKMIRSGREHLSGKVGSVICKTEYDVWAKEFGDLRFELQNQLCAGGGSCALRFVCR